MRVLATQPEKIELASNDVDSTLLFMTSIEDDFFKISSTEMDNPVLRVLTRFEDSVYQSTMVIEGVESPEDLKDVFGLLWAHALSQPETVSVIQFSEAWLVVLEKGEANDTAPSKHPRRVEAFITIAGFPNGRIINRNSPFKRSKKKAIPERVGSTTVIDTEESGTLIHGRLLGDSE